MNDKSSPEMSSEQARETAQNNAAAAAASSGAPAPGMTGGAPAGGAARRVIKRYSNRKLYDTKDSRYVTLLQIAEMVRSAGDHDEEVQIIDNNTKEDLTEVTLAQIIYEEQKAHARNVPLQTLKELIHSRTEKVLTELREGPIGRLIPGSGNRTEHSEGEAGDKPSSQNLSALASGHEKHEGETGARGIVSHAKETIEEWQHKVDERVKAVVPAMLPWSELLGEVKRLRERVEELETQAKERHDKDHKGHS